jgi:hypothetical protein
MDESAVESKSFLAMSPGEKALFFIKLCVFFVTFGFAFPRVLSDLS